MTVDGIADYKFIKPMGDAAHGRLYLAHRPARVPGEGPTVLVKVVEGATDDAFRRFTRELRAYAAVASPYLVALVDAGQQLDVFFSAREHLPMGTLETPTDSLDRASSLRAVAHTALAAHALHEAGIAHRDIRPGNIWLHESGAKLGDLGLAQQTEGAANMTTMVSSVRSVAYLDPTSVYGEPGRSGDIYALGVTLHFALTGRTVYDDLPDDMLVAMRTILRTRPRVGAELSPEEAAVVEVCIAADPADRPATAAEVADLIFGLGAPR